MSPSHSTPTIWSRPLPPGPDRDRWIACVLEMVESEKQDDTATFIASHWVFCKKVLRETKQDCMQIAARFQDVPLTLDVCHRMADEWWEPTKEAAA